MDRRHNWSIFIPLVPRLLAASHDDDDYADSGEEASHDDKTMLAPLRSTALRSNVLGLATRPASVRSVSSIPPPPRPRSSFLLPSSVVRQNSLRVSPRPAFLRFASSLPPPPRPRSSFLSKAATTAKYSSYFCLSAIFGVVVIGAGILVHDAFTYNDRHSERVPVNPLALNPEKGGPKNLPVVKVLIGDDDSPENKEISKKPRLVIVGGGWGVCVLGLLVQRF